MESLLHDLRYAIRRLRKAPVFSAIVVATLALGIGANTAIFSVVNAVLLRPLPYREPDRLVTVFHFYPGLNALEAPVSAPGFRDYRDRANVFQSAAIESGWGPNLTGIGDPERLNGSRVTALWFRTLGADALVGRVLREEEDVEGRNRVVVLSYGLWQRLYGGERSAIGKSMTLNGEPYVIVGVMPAEFRDFWNRRADLWTPMALPTSIFSDQNRTNEWANFTARLRPGMTVEQAARDLTAFATQLKREFPDAYPPDWTLRVRSLDDHATRNIRGSLFVLLGVVAMVLLIACANVANLMLARAAARLKEIAIRTALGAKRAQLVRQLLTESVVLALAGGTIGLGLAYGAVRAVVAINPANLPRSDEIGVDGLVMVFTLVVSLITGLLFGLVPALQTSRANLQETLKEGGRGASADRSGHRARRVLVVAQVALALTLLAGAGLLIKSFARLANVSPGFDADNLLTFNLSLPVARYPSDTAQRAFFDEVMPRIAAVPGVKAVGASSVMPFSGWSTGSFSVEGYTAGPNQPGPWGDIRVVTPGFFQAMGMKLKRGRFFSEQDGPSSPPVVVVDEEMVKRFWPNTDPIGKRITRDDPQRDSVVRWLEVIGVVAHSTQEALDAKGRVQLYYSSRQRPQRGLTVAVRTANEPLAMTNAVRLAVQSIDKDLPLANVLSMDQLMASSVGQRRLSMVLTGVFAALALVLASIGIYGVMSYAVAQRSHELGIRMALGAARGNVLGLVIGQGMVLALIGIAVGLAGALALTRLIRTQLFQVSERDPATFVLVAVVLAVVGLVATLVPALRATRVDPVVALRME